MLLDPIPRLTIWRDSGRKPKEDAMDPEGYQELVRVGGFVIFGLAVAEMVKASHDTQSPNPGQMWLLLFSRRW